MNWFRWDQVIRGKDSTETWEMQMRSHYSWFTGAIEKSIEETYIIGPLLRIWGKVEAREGIERHGVERRVWSAACRLIVGLYITQSVILPCKMGVPSPMMRQS